MIHEIIFSYVYKDNNLYGYGYYNEVLFETIQNMLSALHFYITVKRLKSKKEIFQ